MSRRVGFEHVAWGSRVRIERERVGQGLFETQRDRTGEVAEEADGKSDQALCVRKKGKRTGANTKLECTAPPFFLQTHKQTTTTKEKTSSSTTRLAQASTHANNQQNPTHQSNRREQRDRHGIADAEPAAEDALEKEVALDSVECDATELGCVDRDGSVGEERAGGEGSRGAKAPHVRDGRGDFGA
eukprot:2998778-Rhodomonas_salina.1